jgi:effector-binding domain-containing protein
MPRVSSIEILKRPKQPVLSVKTKTNLESLPMLIGEVYGKIMSYLEEIGEFPSDIPFVAYYNMDMENLDVEIGFPVYKSLPGKDDIQSSYTPEMKVVYSMYQGPYSEGEATFKEIMKYIEDNNLKQTGTMYEYYFNSPLDVDEKELLTMMLFKVD